MHELKITCYIKNEQAVHYIENAIDGTLGYRLHLGRRYDTKVYCKFLDHFGPSLLGVRRWRMKRESGNWDSLLTIGDEAFLLAVLDGNWNRWNHMLVHKGDDEQMKKIPVSTPAKHQ